MFPIKTTEFLWETIYPFLWISIIWFQLRARGSCSKSVQPPSRSHQVRVQSPSRGSATSWRMYHRFIPPTLFPIYQIPTLSEEFRWSRKYCWYFNCNVTFPYLLPSCLNNYKHSNPHTHKIYRMIINWNMCHSYDNDHRNLRWVTS